MICQNVIFKKCAFLLLTMAFLVKTLFSADTNFKNFIKPLFQESCQRCHGEKDKVKGKVNLLNINEESHLLNNPELIENIIYSIEDEEMPPEDEPQLTEPQRQQLLSSLNKLLQTSINSRITQPTTELHRMNRFQYNNAVQDLLGLKVDLFSLPEKMMRDYGYFKPATGKMPSSVKVGSRPLGKSQMIDRQRLGGVFAFPQDLRAEHGFDNRGDHLSLSPLLLESFLKLSQSIVNSKDFNKEKIGIWKSFFAAPDKDTYKVETEKRLQKFLTRAFRQPIDTKTLDNYVSYAQSHLATGKSFEESMKETLSAILASPRFFYYYYQGIENNQSTPLNDYELASRLALFLWGSIPDDTLLDLASKGILHDKAILKQQVQRMLNDYKLKRFCDSFASQWMQLERIISSTPDKKEFPDFYFAKYRKSLYMMLEPLLVFETILIENRSILDFIDSDFTYQMDAMKDWYLKNPKGKLIPTTPTFNRIELNDRRQGGIITTSAAMTMTSGISRSHPITRGAWLLTVIFNDPPPPPPADVPPLPEKFAIDDNQTLRERFSEHRSRSDCKSCHVKIDPLGFALENFDAVGKWRDTYPNGRKVDSYGVLNKKHKFTDIYEFKDAILKEKEAFLKGFSKHLLSFALGRECRAIDTPVIESIVQNTIKRDYKMKALIEEVILSDAFLNKYNPINKISHVD